MNRAVFTINFKNENSSRQAIFPIWLRAAPLLPWAIFAFKVCGKCRVKKSILEFSLHKKTCSGLKSECKKCIKIYRDKHINENRAYAKKYYKANKTKLIKAVNNYRENNKEKVEKVRKAYSKANKNKLRVLSKEYYHANKEKRVEYSRKYEKINKKKINKRRRAARNANPEETRAKSKAWREKNKDKIKNYYLNNKDKIIAYRKANKEEINAKCRARYAANKKEISARDKERRNSEPKYKLDQNISRAIRVALAGNKNGRHWEDLVNFTLADLKKHLEKRFEKGMTWENYGNWQIDHKIPKSVFNYTMPEHEDFKKCWALSNLQPLWAKDNAKKGVYLAKHFQPSLQI